MWNFLLTHTPLLYFVQSLWRDEAFSVLVAEKPISFFFGKLTFEPPFYYILLHFWIKIFGESEIAVRSLSFLAFALAIVVVIFWAEKLFKKHWLSWFLPLFFFVNPMLLYYAFEARTYGWYIFFAVLSMYAYMEKKWRTFIVASVLGFYTHSFFILLPAVCALHFAVIRLQKKRVALRPSLIAHPMIVSLISIGLLIAPWLFVISKTFGVLKNSWYFPVDFQLVRSVIGNVFLGYEGTPGYLWNSTFIFSIILILSFILTLKSSIRRERNLFFLLSVFFPLCIVIGISFIKPIFVNRYVIFVSIAEIFLITFAIENMTNAFLQKLTASIFLTGVIVFNIWYAPFHKKVDIRDTFAQINAVKTDKDVIFAHSPLVFFESIYYSKNRSQVYLFNPNEGAFPWYVGDILVSPSQMATTIPVYPNRAFIVNTDGSFMVTYQTSVIAKPKNK